MTAPLARADVAVIGGGIVGVCAARALAREGARVVLIEKGAVGGAVSGGSLACVGAHMMAAGETRALAEAARLWRALSDALGDPFEHRAQGQLRFALTEAELAGARACVAAERREGLDVSLLDPMEVREVEPALTGPVLGATWSPADATVNPFLAVRALLSDAVRAGMRPLIGCEATGVAVEGGRVAGVATRDGPVAADAVVIAAGPWTAPLARTAGLSPPIAPRKAQCLVSLRWPPTIRTVVGACEAEGGVAAGYTQIQQAPAGQILFNTVLGEAAPGTSDPDRPAEVDRRFVIDSLRMLARLFPSLRELPVLRSWVRHEATTPDGRFLAGATAVEGLYLAAGDNGTGFVRAPLLGRMLADLILRRSRSLGSDLYDPDRWAG